MIKELGFLERIREDAEDIGEIDQKIDRLKKRYNEERQYIEKLANKIVHKNKELKEIKNKTGMETVPWKIHIK